MLRFAGGLARGLRTQITTRETARVAAQRTTGSQRSPASLLEFSVKCVSLSIHVVARFELGGRARNLSVTAMVPVGGSWSVNPWLAMPFGMTVRVVTFSFLCPLLEKYGTFIARCNALIEKVSSFRVATHRRPKTQTGNSMLPRIRVLCTTFSARGAWATPACVDGGCLGAVLQQ
eukprot:SAG31_NODE_4344_length_3330_cov_1.716496_4_plen_175_part_00